MEEREKRRQSSAGETGHGASLSLSLSRSVISALCFPREQSVDARANIFKKLKGGTY